MSNRIYRQHGRPQSAERLTFKYPIPPDKLKLFSKHGYVERPKTAAVDYLEHMLTKTSLTTQKASHENIEEIGRNVYERKVLRFQKEKELAVQNAISETTKQLLQQFDKELRSKLQNAYNEKERALENQLTYYENLAGSTKTNRDLLENERKHQLIEKMNKEKEDALKQQWELAEKLKAEAIEVALTEQHKKLRSIAVIEREDAVAQALRVAKKQSTTKVEKEVTDTQSYCKKITDEMLEKQKRLHQVEIRHLNERIAQLTQESRRFHHNEKTAQKDYVDIESDYSKFLDLTETTPCHSDYLITPRKHLHGIGTGRLSKETQTNLIALEQDTRTVQTDIQICAIR
uniref:Golgin subfamily A member 6-like protein 2 n=1 Tax=Phallusia mammillata TaxID=59560 RepID=A0A6F9DD73_9ASCI|nr:golgin subfamily A member 6-like protein 2 [Phallusia mammillata]